jgi:hypothetical protein
MVTDVASRVTLDDLVEAVVARAPLLEAAARERLAEFKRRIEAGAADFAALARDNSQDASAAGGGDLGWANPGMFVPEFEEVMNKLQLGQIADPMISRFGVHLIQVLERREAPVTERELRDMARAVDNERRAGDEARARADELASAYGAAAEAVEGPGRGIRGASLATKRAAENCRPAGGREDAGGAGGQPGSAVAHGPSVRPLLPSHNLPPPIKKWNQTPSQAANPPTVKVILEWQRLQARSFQPPTRTLR